MKRVAHSEGLQAPVRPIDWRELLSNAVAWRGQCWRKMCGEDNEGARRDEFSGQTLGVTQT